MLALENKISTTLVFSQCFPSLIVQDLFLLYNLFHYEDAQRIMRLRPSITGSDDRLYWRYSKTGSYTVKSGYHLQSQIDSEQERLSDTAQSNQLSQVLLQQNMGDTKNNLALLLGWRIWKMRNKLLFQNKREHITHTINAAIIDKKLWDEAMKLKEQPQLPSQPTLPNSTSDIIGEDTMLYCIADASWKTSNELAGSERSHTNLLKVSGKIIHFFCPSSKSFFVYYIHFLLFTVLKGFFILVQW
ncbi:uncharacterized protein LOC108855464 isoform X2 [Raphanus sativus]|uniref:Uncharacterized protein LOC108855464 isoform X2 n=1 Tax=Raphanus sativus TaxID=3726 RepID=A0A6J0NJ72_RAPSA|nr:uncharacterized protein LOC108855464 isoform X2 [Raphanus sativus]